MVPIGFQHANMYVTSHENVTFHDENLAIIAAYLFWCYYKFLNANNSFKNYLAVSL